jgi:hypothetical protein
MEKEMQITKKYIEWMCEPPNKIFMLIKPIDVLYAEYIKFVPVDVLYFPKQQYIKMMTNTFNLSVILQDEHIYFDKNL